LGVESIIAFDEVQEARGYKPLVGAIAHFYDYNRRVRFVLAGSQTGVLNDFLGIQDPSSPLFGRYIYELALMRFSKQNSLELLSRGFEACGKEPVNVEEAVQKLDGVVGRLMY
jgi:AAA+ ATPase superfamily predicted ATPase